MQVEYTMFLNNGLPVRAKVDLELREIQLQILQLLQGEEGPEREVELAKLEAKHEETVASQKSLSEQLGNALLEGHESFHPQWGQVRNMLMRMR